MKKVLAFLTPLAAFLACAPLAFAHEVYVLNQSEINYAMLQPSPDFISTIATHLPQFLMWGGIVVALIFIIFFLSITKPIEKFCAPFLMWLKKYAPHIAQLTLGFSLLASGYYGAAFGVELPLGPLFGSAEHIVAWILMICGVMLVVGFLPRLAAIVSGFFFIILVAKFNHYMLNYGTYFGESLAIVLYGGAHTLFSNRKMKNFFTKMIPEKFHNYKFLMMRIFFGSSLIYASLYAKLFHGALAVEVVSKYHLTHYFPFDPLFLVLGAMLVEVLIGLFIMFGFEIRFASLFFLVFLTLSLQFFGEAVWPHIVLIGTALAMFAHGYDKYCVSSRMSKNKKGMEPVM